MRLAPKTFTVDVPEIGTFTFKKRRVPEQVQLESLSLEYTNGQRQEDSHLANMAHVFATLSVLMVKAPDGFDLDEMDPLDAADTDRMWAVWKELRDTEAAFRKGA